MSGFQKKEIESWHEEESLKLSLFLSRFAHDIHFDPTKDVDTSKK
jgi:hypothetical protein